MKIISHRGNTSGPNPARENSPSYLLEAINLGVDVEVDVRSVSDNIFLGHSSPQYQVDLSFIDSIKDRAWFHCKNLEALELFVSLGSSYKYFWHQSDDYALTSTGNIWVYPNKKYSSSSIVVDLSPTYSYKSNEIFAACVDFI